MTKSHIAIMTSGGDVPGLNAAIRAAVRAASFYQYKIIGIEKGYEGLIDEAFLPLHSGSVSNIISKGGTILQSSRSERFKEEKFRQIAYQNLKKHNIEHLILIGGDGSMRGAQVLAKESGINVIGIPKTIDNDITGTDFSIGFDTATNIAMEAIDRIRDTATSHHRLFFVEVMGRNAGYIALEAGIATGAEGIIIPETNRDLQLLYDTIEQKKNWKNSSYIVVVAEGDEIGGAYRLEKTIQQKYPNIYTGVSILGHIQRGGSPTCRDRNLATKLGIASIEAVNSELKNVMAGVIHENIQYTPLENIGSRKLKIDDNIIKNLKILSK
ncbi:MAG: 6-phosphofructokinase [Chitinophagales bacterium]|nr:6-phosphofructokinase [Chitinophagales bacterium]MCZ2392903.1 6-phosphofructokinase [Chitinophagales bacterium]